MPRISTRSCSRESYPLQMIYTIRCAMAIHGILLSQIFNDLLKMWLLGLYWQFWALGENLQYSRMVRYSSKVTWHTQIKHIQLIGQKHAVTSTHIGVCSRKTSWHYFCKRQEGGLRGHYSGSSRGYILFFKWLCTYTYVPT